MRFTFIWVFGELFERIQGVEISCYAYWTIGRLMSVMNDESMIYNLLWYWDWWMNLWWCMHGIDLNDHNMHDLMNDITCE